MLVPACQTKQHHISDDCNLDSHHREISYSQPVDRLNGLGNRLLAMDSYATLWRQART
jgi:hypothetical protein